MRQHSSQLFDLGAIGVAKIIEDAEDGGPILQIFAGGEVDGNPCIVVIGEPLAIESIIKIGRALSAWNQEPRRDPPSSDLGGLTLDPI